MNAVDDDNQILVPDSFIALFSDARGRLREKAPAVRERYELCEDMACALVAQAEQLFQREGSSGGGVLLGLHAALGAGETGLTNAEARWVTLRLAELLGWPCPTLPGSEAISPR